MWMATLISLKLIRMMWHLVKDDVDELYVGIEDQ